MADLQGRKVFKVFNQDFIVDERYTVTKELGQGAYGIVWYGMPPSFSTASFEPLLIRLIAARLRIPRPKKVSQSRKLPMSSARRSLQSARSER
jgi:mitogen-activated protein kinase 7